MTRCYKNFRMSLFQVIKLLVAVCAVISLAERPHDSEARALSDMNGAPNERALKKGFYKEKYFKGEYKGYKKGKKGKARSLEEGEEEYERMLKKGGKGKGKGKRSEARFLEDVYEDERALDEEYLEDESLRALDEEDMEDRELDIIENERELDEVSYPLIALILKSLV